jgi:hypothetical protein
METEIITVNIKTKPRAGTIVFFMVWLIVAGFINSKQNLPWLKYLFEVVFVYVLIYFLWMLTGGVRLIITNEKLIVKKMMMGFPYLKKSYFLSKVEYVRKSLNEKADSYWALGSRVNASYKTFKWYDLNPTVLYFTYENSTIKIGEGLKAFDVDFIITEIKKRK